jgi:manganese/zinc/iron transport system permease protein
MTPSFEIALIMIAVGVACAVPGVFLVLRKLAMVSDAIGHTLLFGIVTAFAIVRDMHSPLLMIGAALTGILTVWCVEWLQKIGRIKQDAAIGLVFPALFALGTLLASLEFRQIHLDVDAVLLGQVETVRLSRFVFPSFSLPRSVMVLGSIAVANILLVILFYRPLKLSTFDSPLAIVLGFGPTLIQLGLVSMASLTAVAAFDSVGPILVVAFFVIPASIAKLICKRLSTMIIYSICIAALAAIVGTYISFWLDTNIPGTTATLLGFSFGTVAVVQHLRS